jgi:hypothetical protein
MHNFMTFVEWGYLKKEENLERFQEKSAIWARSFGDCSLVWFGRKSTVLYHHKTWSYDWGLKKKKKDSGTIPSNTRYWL